MPVEVRELIKISSSINTSGNMGSNEGPDFKLESINKQTQHWVPKVPSGTDWENICCNYDTLTLLRGETFVQLGLQDPKVQKPRKTKELSNEVTAIHVLLRTKHYLSDPLSPKPLSSLDDSPLDPMLSTFSTQAREKRGRFFDVYMQHEIPRTCARMAVPFHEPPVFVTPQERKDYEAVTYRTIAELKVIIDEKIQTVSVQDVREVFQESYVIEVTKKKGVKNQITWTS